MNKLFQIIKKYFSLQYTNVVHIRSNRKRILLMAIALFVIVLSFYTAIIRPPSGFQSGSTVTIEEGDTISSIAIKLKEQHIVRSSVWLKNLARVLNGKSGILSGDYFFEKPENIFTVAWRMTKGTFNLDLVQVFIPEGANVFEIAQILDNKLDSFDKEKFLKLAKGKEGYLFPDTYFFLPKIKEKDIIKELSDTFSEKIAEVDDEIKNFDKKLEDIIIMASILEKEARTTETRKMISGILWERMRIGMPLQVDAVFVYANGKNSFTLTTEDLRDDHPYNTYTNKGLPPTPIANPGLDSIRAAVNPIPSDYLFFLSDMSGNMHYSDTFQEHMRKKNIYLN